jgi:2-polyprenyl-3-methyl-5-hydroxy-6-metoxy-1,4-benzoquinol methylase
MKSSFLEAILKMIEVRNPKHAAKIAGNLIGLNDFQILKADSFLRKYFSYLERENKSLDFGVECYLHMIDDIFEERTEFVRSGKYSCNSFEEVERRVYKNPDIMLYHMHGLVLAQFIWYEQIQRFTFFSQNLVKYTSGAVKYLEIGGGHGLYIDEAFNSLPFVEQFDLVDISQSSLDLAKGILVNDRIDYILKNILEFNKEEQTYDFITIGEVLEHLEDPVKSLKEIGKLLKKSGACFISVPVNAPMIDHIFLFNNVEEIHELINLAGMEILEETTAIADNESENYAEKFKTAIMYAAFIQLKNIL